MGLLVEASPSSSEQSTRGLLGELTTSGAIEEGSEPRSLCPPLYLSFLS